MKLQDIENTIVFSKGREQELQFGIGDTAVIIEILRSKMYSHPIRTLVQEYLCNARDACREKTGASDDSCVDIDVTLPTNFLPVFSVRDYGVGLSPERVANVFVLYGATTKRTDNQQTGGFGIGAKSAWAYTDSFMVTSFYEGKKYSYIAHIGDTKSGSLTLLNVSDTEECNGVEISITVQDSDIESFIQAYARAVLFWRTRPRLLNAVSQRTALLENIFSCVEWTKYGVAIKDGPMKHQLRDVLPTSCGEVILNVDGVIYSVDIPSVNTIDMFKKVITGWLLQPLRAVTLPVGSVKISANRETVTVDEELSKLVEDDISKRASAIKSDVDPDNRSFGILRDIDSYSMFHEYFIPINCSVHTNITVRTESDKRTNELCRKKILKFLSVYASATHKFLMTDENAKISKTFTCKDFAIPIFDSNYKVYVAFHQKSSAWPTATSMTTCLRGHESTVLVVIGGQYHTMSDRTKNILGDIVKKLGYNVIDSIYDMPNVSKVDSKPRSDKFTVGHCNSTKHVISKSSVGKFLKRFPNAVLAPLGVHRALVALGFYPLSHAVENFEALNSLGIPHYETVINDDDRVYDIVKKDLDVIARALFLENMCYDSALSCYNISIFDTRAYTDSTPLVDNAKLFIEKTRDRMKSHTISDGILDIIKANSRFQVDIPRSITEYNKLLVFMQKIINDVGYYKNSSLLCSKKITSGIIDAILNNMEAPLQEKITVTIVFNDNRELVYEF